MKGFFPPYKCLCLDIFIGDRKTKRHNDPRIECKRSMGQLVLLSFSFCISSNQIHLGLHSSVFFVLCKNLKYTARLISIGQTIYRIKRNCESKKKAMINNRSDSSDNAYTLKKKQMVGNQVTNRFR